MDLQYHDTAVGPCIQCGEESEGSVYWLGMTDEMWDILRPSIEARTVVSPYSGVKLVFNNLFWPGLCEPFCGAVCVTKYEEKNDGAGS